MLLLGIDISETQRIKKSMGSRRFLKEILGSEEYAQLEKRGFPAESVAASFSAKEAFSKAVGTGLGSFAFREVQLIREKSGRPRLKLCGKAAELARGFSFSVSATHSGGFAAAAVVGEECRRAFVPEENKIPELRRIIKERPKDSNKGTFGRLMCVCGSEGMAGAAVMSAGAALRCGTGLVDAALPRCIYPIVASRLAEPVFTILDTGHDGKLSEKSEALFLEALAKSTACLIGCGLGKSTAAREETAAVLAKSEVPLVIDADGINIISENINILKTARAKVILTPHPGEMSRLLKVPVSLIQSDRKKYASDFSARHNVVLVLKGAGTVVAAPDGRLYENTTGNPGMAKGGSGDVLAGMTASFAAQGADPFEAAAAAVYMHGLAGDMCAEKLSQSAMLPTDIIDMLPSVFSIIGR
ncbi:MAG TPA: hypothetical protein DIV41_08730 [Ruminococcaceae bacterium]|nr:hypothetical protein [Oscillospiraceae bacterium]